MTKSDTAKIVEDHIRSIESQLFQGFCDRLLIKLYSDYTPVRAGGSHGDMKNDGYRYLGRVFFQAHASRGESASKIKTKIETDLKGCLDKQTDVQKFIYLTNDTLIGEIEKFIDDLRRKYGIDIETWEYKKLADKISDLDISDVEYIIDRRLVLIKYEQITVEEEKDYGIIEEIFDFIFKKLGTTYRGEISNNRLTEILEKIKLNFSSENQKVVRKLVSDLWEHKNLVETFVQEQSRIDENEVLALQIFITNRFLEIRGTSYIDESVRNYHIFEKIALTLIPNKHVKNSKYIINSTAIVLYFWELCNFGKRTKNQGEQTDLFNQID
ncbi:hypothetical protein GCM10011514_03230 [Emticicia aquatilis]|uniref:Uncharacterized protein n=1 Tax=Emticicia aquatilis TaxID=1537369 RepID=A0A917DI81_9BACT|nr:hypothetical protein [Emticicia aquatilis]GGD42612.1 hypothetical protein GCM10011514_03230 [Emticicia aquatilis]